MNNKISRSEYVYRELKKAILYGFSGFLPGNLLNENKLAETWNVSKTPVREALNRLRNETLVEVIPYKGYLVSNPSVKELIDLFQIRLILESASVELATVNITDAQLDELRQLTLQSPLEPTDDFKLNFRKANLEFHTKVAEASGNPLLANLVKQNLEQMQRALFHNVSESEIDHHHQEHRELINALEEKNIKLAVDNIKKQIQLSKERIFNFRDHSNDK